MKGWVYQLSSSFTDKIYIGSTANNLSQRFREHKSAYNVWLQHGSAYCSSFEIMKFSNAKIELLEEIEFENALELRELEQFFIDNLENVCNKNVTHIPSLDPALNVRACGRPHSMMSEEHKKRDRAEYMKKYYENNKARMCRNAAILYQKRRTAYIAAKNADAPEV